jgi:hypothetical protein
LKTNTVLKKLEKGFVINNRKKENIINRMSSYTVFFWISLFILLLLIIVISSKRFVLVDINIMRLKKAQRSTLACVETCGLLSGIMKDAIKWSR